MRVLFVSLMFAIAAIYTGCSSSSESFCDRCVEECQQDRLEKYDREWW